MTIKVDKEGMEAIKALCDIALKVGGLRNFEGVRQVLNAVRLIEDAKQENE